MKNFFKRKWKEICAVALMILSTSLLSFEVFVVSKGYNLKFLKISDMGKFYTKLNAETQRYIQNNIFSLRYEWINTKGDKFNIYGTCWSVYHDSCYWYLMTNEHVVDEIIESASWNYPSSFGSMDNPPLSGNLLHDPETKQIIGRECQYKGNMYLRSNINGSKKLLFEATNPYVISTRLGSLGTCPKDQIFAGRDVKKNKVFQTDMALIKLCLSDINAGEFINGDASAIKASDWIPKNTYSLKIEDFCELAKTMPTKLTKRSDSPNPVYYTGGYPFSRLIADVRFTDGIIEGKITEKGRSLSRQGTGEYDIHAANAWSTILPYEQADPGALDPRGWKMQGGSSGSPLIELEKKEDGLYGIKQEMPVAIYWGGTISLWRKKELFFPTFDLFCEDDSDPYVADYNIVAKLCCLFQPKPMPSPCALK